MTGNTNRITRAARLALALCAFGCTLIVATSAGAQSGVTYGQVGDFEVPAGATCYFAQDDGVNRLLVQAPSASSSPVQMTSGPVLGVGGYFGGGFHMQYVGYQARLWKLGTNGYVDTGVVGSWRYAIFGDKIAPGPSWWDLSTNSSAGNGTTEFDIYQPGTYVVTIDIVWFTGSEVTGEVYHYGIDVYNDRYSSCQY